MVRFAISASLAFATLALAAPLPADSTTEGVPLSIVLPPGGAGVMISVPITAQPVAPGPLNAQETAEAPNNTTGGLGGNTKTNPEGEPTKNPEADLKAESDKSDKSEVNSPSSGSVSPPKAGSETVPPPYKSP